MKGWYSSLPVLLGVLDLDDEALEVARRPDGGDVARGQDHVPAVAGVEAVGVVVDALDLSAEAVGVGLRDRNRARADSPGRSRRSATTPISKIFFGGGRNCQTFFRSGRATLTSGTAVGCPFDAPPLSADGDG